MTATGPSLQKAQAIFSSTTSGARSSAKKVIFLLTDGRSNRGVKPKIPADQLKGSGTEIYVLGKRFLNHFKLYVTFIICTNLFVNKFIKSIQNCLYIIILKYKLYRYIDMRLYNLADS